MYLYAWVQVCVSFQLDFFLAQNFCLSCIFSVWVLVDLVHTLQERYLQISANSAEGQEDDLGLECMTQLELLTELHLLAWRVEGQWGGSNYCFSRGYRKDKFKLFSEVPAKTHNGMGMNCKSRWVDEVRLRESHF